MQWVGLMGIVFACDLIFSTEAITRTYDEIKFKCAKCECCRGGCDQMTGICDDRSACLDGYWGHSGSNNGGDDGDCRHECYDTNPPCISCGILGGVWCSTCVDGFYVEPPHYRQNNPHCTLECNPGCQACVESASACTSCKSGFYGPTSGCTGLCHPNCYRCSEASSCTECPAGKHGTLCEQDCPDNCVNCTSSTQCIACNSGYYGETCLTPCSPGCNSGNCGKRSGGCSPCIMDFEGAKCDICVSGKYGINCDQDCPTGCDSRGCQRESGDCIECRPNFAGTNCENCVMETQYGMNCDQDCPVYCHNGVCDRLQGICTNGCQHANMEGDMCDRCEVGWYGSECSFTCSLACRDSECYRYNGTCANGCIGSFKGHDCLQCVPGTYGLDCSTDCPINCLNGVCYKVTGYCEKCSGNFMGSRCEQCMDGFFGDDCTMQCAFGCLGGSCDMDTGECNICDMGFYGMHCTFICSTGCKHGSCIQETGVCSYGCESSYSGDKCCVLAETGRCQECLAPDKCSVCATGLFGPHCNQTCSIDCIDSCDISSGHCNACKRDRYGSVCEVACPSNCFDDHGRGRICSLKSGICESGCADRFYGDTCEDECSQGCVDMVCSQQDGHCDCIEGRSGDRCEEVGVQSMILYASVGSLCFVIVLLVVIVVIMCVLRYRNKTKSNEKDSMKSDKASNKHGGQAMTHINSGNDVEPGYESLEVNIADAGLYNTIDAMAGTNRV